MFCAASTCLLYCNKLFSEDDSNDICFIAWLSNQDTTPPRGTYGSRYTLTKDSSRLKNMSSNQPHPWRSISVRGSLGINNALSCNVNSGKIRF